MLRLFSAAIIAVLLLVVGMDGAVAASLNRVLEAVAPIKVITPDMMQAGTLGNGREGFLYKSVEDGLILSVAGPATDVDEVNALVSLGGAGQEAVSKAIGISVLVAAVTKDKASHAWAGEALKNLGNGWKATFSGWAVDLSPVADTSVIHVLITKTVR